jgi:hypothetical protein
MHLDNVEEILKKWAKEFNDEIIKQEGYDPVGEKWILKYLLKAFQLGLNRGYEKYK